MMRECLCAAVVIIASPTRQVREYLNGDTSFISKSRERITKKCTRLWKIKVSYFAFKMTRASAPIDKFLNPFTTI